jgi:3-oxoacyl-[acyl-carrier-protein] synthase-3
MAYQKIKQVRISGIAACVPGKSEENKSLSFFSRPGDYERFVATTGIERRRLAEAGVCTSDLCYVAAQKLIDELGWEKSEIGCLVFVTQTPDYVLPATSCILQERLGLSKDTMAMDISLGCSGWVYGLTTIASLVAQGSMRKALLLVGDTVSVTKSSKDKTTYPMFGDAGTATALEFDPEAPDIDACLFTDGGRHEVIMIRDGGYRHPFSSDSLVEREYENGGIRNNLQSYLDGTSVFTFGISQAPQCVSRLLSHCGIAGNDVDLYVFHQANLLMNEKIRMKMKIPPEKVPYVLKDFGNTSSASIPLALVVKEAAALRSRSLQIVACGFGVGLSWGAVHFKTDSVVCCDLLEL